MFGFRGGETGETVTRKRAYMRDAQRRWPFITYFDASTVHGPEQLAVLISTRSSCSREQAQDDVGRWSAGKDFAT
jgi:hypothetical protein